MSLIDWSNAPKFGRIAGIKGALQKLHDLCKQGEKRTIVEIGCARGDCKGSMEGDGWSTVAFGWYCSKNNGQLTTIDLSDKSIKVCKSLTANYSDCIDYVCKGSIEGLYNLREAGISVDLLYLDGSRHPANSYCEYYMIKNNLSERAIILIDDVNFDDNGKGKLVIPQLIQEGWLTNEKNNQQQMFWRK